MTALRGLRGTDVALAALFAVGGCVEVALADDPPGPWLQVLYVLATAAAVLARRAAPVWSAAVFLAATAVVCAATQPYQLLAIGLAFLVLPFSYLDHPGRRRFAALALLMLAVALRSLADPGEDWGAALVDQLFVLMAAAAGTAVRHYRRRVEHVASVAERQLDDAVALERDRIARELHDIVGHGMSVMVIQADAARHCLEPGHDEVRDALLAIEQTGRDSLRELRRLLGLLRDESEPAALEPTPGMDDLGDLVDSIRRAGVAVDLEIAGEPRGLSSGVALTAYRVVQEALTNVLRHARPAHARVLVVYGEQDLRVEVFDDGDRGQTERPPGRGLIGLRERVRLYDGTFTSGPEGQSWVVRATMPVEAAGQP